MRTRNGGRLGDVWRFKSWRHWYQMNLGDVTMIAAATDASDGHHRPDMQNLQEARDCWMTIVCDSDASFDFNIDRRLRASLFRVRQEPGS